MKNTRVLTFLCFGFALGGLPALAQSGGSLEPSGAPGPTMRTLDDIGEAADAAVDPRTPIAAADLPVTIDQPGSYYFAEDMLFAEASGNAINITSSNVTLDLMGFALRSTPEVTGEGIFFAQESKNITIRNGHIAGNTVVTVDAGTWTATEAGFRYGIISGGSFSGAKAIELERLKVSGCRSGGIRFLGIAAVIDSCVAFSNGGNGIQAGFGSTVKNSIARQNTGTGIQIFSGSLSHSSAENNQKKGITAADSSVSYCAAKNNGDDGIELLSGGVVAFCIASGNGTISGTDINAPGATRTGNNPTP